MTKTSDLIRAELSLEKGSSEPGKEFVADMTLPQALNVADKKNQNCLHVQEKQLYKKL